MTTSDNNRSTTFWTGASVGLAVATIFVCALTGYFVLSGLPRIVEAVAFGLAGTLVFFALVVAARLLARGLRRVPPRVCYFAVAALGTLHLLRANRFRTEGSGVVILDDSGFRRRSDALSSEAVELMGDIQ